MRARPLALVLLLAAACPDPEPQTITLYSVGGTVSGLAGSDLILKNGEDQLPIARNGAFTFPTALAYGSTYEVAVVHQPSFPDQTCTIEKGSGVVIEQVDDIVVTCATNRYAVGGTISGLKGMGLVLHGSTGEDQAIATDATSYKFLFPSGERYKISVKTAPVKPSQTCTIASAEGEVDSEDVVGVDVSCATNAYPVGGAINGLLGSGLVLTNGDEELPIEATAKSYSFEVESGAAYEIKIKTQPSNPTQTCTLANPKGTADDKAIDNVTVTCATNSYAVGGPVSGLLGSGLVLQNNGADDLPLAAGTTSYHFTVPNGAGYDITVKSQPTIPSQTCVVENPKGTVGSADVANVAVKCTTNVFDVGGAVVGYLGSGLVIVNDQQELAVPKGASSYAFKVESGKGYALTVKTQPSDPSQTCVIANPLGLVTSASVGNATVTCTTNKYAVGGPIGGLKGSGLVLQNKLANDLPVAAGAVSYSFQVASGDTYAISVKDQPSNPEQTCTVSNESGKVGAANVADAEVKCVTKTYTVGGPVSGLQGTGLMLQDGLGHEVSLSAGATTYQFQIASGSGYAITVKTQPSSPTQFCSVSNASGTVTNANVSNVAVSCQTNTYTVGGKVSGLKGMGLTLLNNGTVEQVIAANATAYTFPSSSGAAYDITVKVNPSNPTQTCTVASGKGTVGSTNVTNADVTCTTSLFSVGGTVAGLVGSAQVVLQNGGADPVTVGNGPFTFPAKVLSGDAYEVTIKTQAPNHACTVESGKGTVGAANVTNVSVRCAWNTLLMLAATSSGAGHLAAAYTAGGSWTSTRLTGSSSQQAPGLAITGAGVGIGLIENASDELLKYTVWDGSGWSQLAKIGDAIGTRSKPSISGSAGTATAQAVFHGFDYKFYAETWTPIVGWTGGLVGSPQGIGPQAPTIVARGGDATVLYVQDSTNKITAMDRANGTWGSPAYINNEVASFSVRPNLAAMSGGPELMAVWQIPCGAGMWCNAQNPRCNTQIRYATRTNGVWSTPADVNYACSDDQVALVGLPSGEALLAWRPTNFNDPKPLTLSTYKPGSSWGNPNYFTSYSLVGSPALARGVGQATAEVAWVGTDYAAYHCRLTESGCFGANGTGPNQVGTGVNFVTLATAP